MDSYIGPFAILRLRKVIQISHRHGFGNWDDISDFIGTNKSREEVEQHYQTIYLQGENFLPVVNATYRQKISLVIEMLKAN
jgi:hypothetical protein